VENPLSISADPVGHLFGGDDLRTDRFSRHRSVELCRWRPNTPILAPPATRNEKHNPVFLDHGKQLLDLVRLGHPLTILEGHDFLHAALFVDDV
jgi:hypothetical protein